MNHPQLDIQHIRQRLQNRRQLQVKHIDNDELGEWIGVRRLESDPTLLKCIECAK